jgi:hypothetical protein
LRRGSIVQPISKEVPWDIFDRLFLPVLYCHAVAIIFSATLQVFEIQFAFSTFGIFILLSIATVTLTLFYHNLKVSYCLCTREHLSRDISISKSINDVYAIRCQKYITLLCSLWAMIISPPMIYEISETLIVSSVRVN